MNRQKTTTSVNIRSGAGVKYQTVTKPLPAGALVSVIYEEAGWSLVQLENKLKGWIRSEFLAPEIVATNNLTIVQIILSIARSQIGLTEIPKGSNWGKHVQKYLASVGIFAPAAWCMAFVYWVVDNACKELKIPNPLIKTGGVLDQWIRIDKRFKIVWRRISPTSKTMDWHRYDVATQSYVRTTIQPADIGIMNFGEGKGHTFFVEKPEERVYTIEGNSNDEGSREGYEVCRKPGGRAIPRIKGFIRLS